MNKTLFLLCCVMSWELCAAGVQWRSWEAAVAESEQSGKIIMVDAVRDGCHYCDDMEAAVFDHEKMAAYIEQGFIPVKVNLSRETMPMGLSVPMTPSFFFISREQELIKMIPGSWNREDFKSFLDSMSQPQTDELR